jgi:DNA-binding response OmpR family regulator/anti-sigma regulatory factor (Ser/Thr protein kinase)
MPTTQTDFLTILVVDDSRLELALLTAMLTKMGHKAMQAGSGEAALELFRQCAPDMVLMDVTMPGMGGYDAVREMRRIMRDEWIPIVFITGMGHEDDIVKGIEAGGDDYLLKPVHYRLLQAKIDSQYKQHLQIFRKMKEQSQLLLDNQAKNEEEQQTAQEFLDRLLALDKLNDSQVQFHLQAAEVFSGDLIAAARTPAGDLYAMLADSTGHGLTAALAVMPVLQTFHAMVAKGYSLSALAVEINRKIGEYLPANRFVAAVLVALDAKNGRLSVWNGGCPPAVLLNPDGMVVYQFDSMHLPLGILNPVYFDDEVTSYHYGNNHCQILLCSDGAVDTADPGSMEIGMSHLLQAARTENVAERLPGMLRMLERQLEGKQAYDDIALILMDCPAEDTESIPIPVQPEPMDREENLIAAITLQEQRKEQRRHEEQAEWKFALTLSAPQLRQADIVPLLLQVVNQIELGEQGLSGKLFLILSELFNNALDHGLLKLDSSLKNDPQGMDHYFEERTSRLKQLEQGEIRIKLLKILTAHGPCLKIVISDTGDGFDYLALQASALDASTRRHGRGIALVESLSSQLHFADNGRESQVLISLENAG